MTELTLPHLPVGWFRAEFSCERPPRFSDFPANAWRGALGHALKRAVCVTHQTDCRACALYHSCLFTWFWDTPPGPGAVKMRKYQTAPHPFVLSVDEARPLTLEFTLFGQANRHLPLFIHVLTQAASAPRGVAGNELKLRSVEQSRPLPDADWRPVFLPPNREMAQQPASVPNPPPLYQNCVIHIQTPLRVKRDGRHVGPDEFVFSDLFGSLLRRISMLTTFHTDTPLETDFRGLMDAARTIDARCHLGWIEHQRHSSRHQATLQMGGVVGKMELSGGDLAPFWPYLWLGQFTHAGSGATMGLGRYRILDSGPASLPDASV